MSSVCRTIRVKNRLADLLFRPGGISRTDAVAAASQEIEMLREEFVACIPSEISALEALAAACGPEQIWPSEIERMLDRAARILTLSGTFGFMALDTVVKRFCDLCAAMADKGMTSIAPINVHLRAMRLVSPDSPQLPEQQVDELLNELAKMHGHFGIGPPAAVEDTPLTDGEAGRDAAG